MRTDTSIAKTEKPFLKLSPEEELLLLCSRTELQPSQAARVSQLVAQNLDWLIVTTLATRHAVLALLFRQLEIVCPRAVPAPVMEQLRAAYKANAYHAIKFTQELRHILSLFEQRNITVMVLKGPVLGELAYEEYTLREFVDLDLVVREKDVGKAGQLLIKQGYKPQHEFGAAQLTGYLKLGNEQNFWQPQTNINIDLHWAIMPKHFSFSANSDLLWQQPITVHLDGYPVLTPAMENMLLFLCMHGAKHNWDSLNHVCDLHELLRRHPAINWKLVEQNAGKIGTHRMLWLGLGLAHTLLGTPLPDHILAQIQAAPYIEELTARVLKIMFPEPTTPNELDQKTKTRQNFAQKTWSYYHKVFSTWLARDPIYQATMEQRRDLILFWADILIPTPLEFVAVPLPSPLFFLYYPLRPLRLVIKYLFGKRQSL